MAVEILGENPTPSALALALDAKVTAMKDKADIEKALAVVELAKQAVRRVDIAFALLEKTHTVEMIQALFILPLET